MMTMIVASSVDFPALGVENVGEFGGSLERR